MRLGVRVLLWTTAVLCVGGVVGASVHLSSRWVPYRAGLGTALPAVPRASAGPSARTDRDALPWPDESLPASVSGTVFRAGAPVGGARVRLFDTVVPPLRHGDSAGDVVSEALPTRMVGEVRADAAGAWRIDGVAPGRYCVVAGPGDDPAATCAARVFVVPPGGVPLREDLALPDGTASVAVRVTGFDGRPFTGRVAARARPFLEVSDVLVIADCDDNGRAAIAGLTLPCWSLWAVSDDGAERGPDVELRVVGEDRTAHAAWALAAPLRPISVACISADDGRPVPGAAVRVRDTLGVRVVRAGDDGLAVAFAGWAATLDVFAPGRARRTRTFPGAPDADAVTIRLPRTGAVAGTVVDVRDDSPAANAVVWAGDPGDPETPHARAGADGSFRIDDCGPGRVRLHILGGGWTHAAADVAFDEEFTREEDTRGQPHTVFTRRDGDPEIARAEVVAGAVATVRLHAEPAARFVGRVVERDGSPVAGARFVIRDRTRDRFPYDVSCVTLADGRFTTIGLRAADQPYYALWREGVVPRLAAASSIGDDGVPGSLYPGVTRQLTITLAPGRQAFARVRDAAGSPVAGAAVMLDFIDPRSVKTVAAVSVTDASGFARFAEVPSTPSWFSVAGTLHGTRGFSSADLSSPSVATPESPVEVVLKPGARYRGVVVADGVPVEGAVLSLAGHHVDQRTLSDERGEFEFVAPADGAVSLAAHAPRGSASVRNFRPVADDAPPFSVELTVPAAPAEEAESAPVAIVLGPGGERIHDFRWTRRTHTRAGGAVVRELRIYGMRDECGVLLPVAPVTIEFEGDDPAACEVRVAAGDGGVVRGCVVDDRGATVAGTVVGLFWAWQRGVLTTKDAIAAMHSAADGSFAFHGMPHGDVVVRAIDRRTGAAGETWVAADAARTGVRVPVTRDGGISILVTDDAERAVAGAEVTIDVGRPGFACIAVGETSFPSTVHRRTGPDGIARFPEIAPSTPCRWIRVRPADRDADILREYTRPDWKAEDATITLR